MWILASLAFFGFEFGLCVGGLILRCGVNWGGGGGGWVGFPDFGIKFGVCFLKPFFAFCR
jgi:hypothetical protein